MSPDRGGSGTGSGARFRNKPPATPRTLTLQLFLVSFSAIADEVLLMRVFSIAEWHHFAWLIISLALLGYAAAGTFVALLRRLLLRRLRTWLPLFALLLAAAIPLSLIVARLVRFNSLEVIWNWHQSLRLFAVYAVLSIPFFAAGSFGGILFTARRNMVATLYRADLLGGGCGAAAAVGLLFLVHVEDALRIAAASAALAALLAARSAHGRMRTAGTALAAGLITLVIVAPRTLLHFPPSPFKDVSQLMRIRGARIVEERSGAAGLVQVIANDDVPFRHAPGLSLAFDGEIPRQELLLEDGSIVTAIPTSHSDIRYTQWVTSAAVHSILDMRRGRLLIIGADAPAILRAIAGGAARVDVVDPDPLLLRLLETRLDGVKGKVIFHCASGRSFLEASRTKWRSIEMSVPPSDAGEAALRENYLLTTNGIALLLQHLESGGAVSVSGQVRTPPNELMRLITTVSAAKSGRRRVPPGSLAVVRGWNAATVLFAPVPFSSGDIEQLSRFSAARSFDLDIGGGRGAMLNVLDRPYLREAIESSFAGAPQREAFIARSRFDVSPATDVRPFFHHFVPWSLVPELVAMRDRGSAALIDSGTIVLAATLLQAIAASLLLVLGPLAVSSRLRPAAGGTWRVVVYFGAIGIAFLAIEIALIHRLTLFVANPLEAASVVLAAFLCFAGFGSAASRSLSHSRLRVVLFSIAVLALVYAAGLRLLFPLFASTAAMYRTIVAIAMIAPIAFLMGMPFPLGISLFGNIHRRWIPWAWGVNGAASVVAAVLAMIGAVTVGIEWVIVAAAATYAVATIALWKQPLSRDGSAPATPGH